jgi:hypothetical protein
MFLSWSPVEGTHNYTTLGVTATPHNVLASKGATAHTIAGTPGTGQIRLGK